MNDKIPRRPVGTDPESIFFQWVWDFITGRGRLQAGQGIVIEQTTRGCVIKSMATAATNGKGNMRWRGEWDEDASYNVYDVVRVTDFDDSLVGDGNNYTGVWLCLAANDGEQPIYPEPTAGTVYWVMLAPGVREMNVSDNFSGSLKQLVACNDAYPP